MTTRRTFLGLVTAGTCLAGIQNAHSAESSWSTATQRAALQPHRLRVEWMSAPLGIDIRRPRFSWNLQANNSQARGLVQSACRVIVATSEQAIRAGRGDLWDSGKVPTSETTLIPPQDLALTSQSYAYWAIQVWDQDGNASEVSAPEAFATGILDVNEWRARWIAADIDPPMPLFRRRFEISKPLRRALVSVSGLGHYELRVNGAATTQSVLDPGWTNYRRTVLYNTFDVTSLLRTGANALGVMLGNGMFNVEKYAGRYTKFAGSFGRPQLILQLKLVFEDGSEQLIVSDASWRTRPGPIVFSSPYGGEDFDARRDIAGWDLPELDESGWSNALEVGGPGGLMRAQGMPSITAARTITPKQVTRPAPNILVYDLGENFSGWPRITVEGTAGGAVKLIPGELLDASGRVSQRSANAAPGRECSFTYTLAGGRKETWRPRFTYWGFRYVQVEFPADVTIASLEGEFLHANLTRSGAFESGTDLLTRTHQLIVQALLSNTFSVLTDCPHREKLGWLEQTHLNADTVFYNLDAITLYRKMLIDMRDAQLPDGAMPEIAPEFVAFLNADGSNSIFRESPEWGAAIVLSPWAAYRYSGDLRLLDDGYQPMCRYADYLQRRRTPEGLLDHGLGDWYDIGPKPVGEAQLTSRQLTGTATYYQLLTVLSKIASLLGKADDAERFKARADSVGATINAKLFDPQKNIYDRGSMTALAMPLALGFVPEARREAVLANLIADIRAHNNHVTAGDVGFHYVVRARMEYGRSDVLYDILSRTDAPSYGHQLATGATALTEAWDANPTKSQNHFMLGHAETWLYGGLAGIQIDMSREPARRLRIAPQMVANVSSAAASYESVLGPVSCAWVRQDSGARVTVNIPAGAQAEITLPGPARAIRESGRRLAEAPGIQGVRSLEGTTIATLQSGRYVFEW